jgi:hypothetical protein
MAFKYYFHFMEKRNRVVSDEVAFYNLVAFSNSDSFPLSSFFEPCRSLPLE